MTRPAADDPLIAAAKTLQRVEKIRSAVFEGRDMPFRDPAWSMMLASFVSDWNGAGLPVKALVAASGVPATTALRHLATLEDNGLMARSANPQDRRSRDLSLTVAGSLLMRKALAPIAADARARAFSEPSRCGPDEHGRENGDGDATDNSRTD